MGKYSEIEKTAIAKFYLTFGLAIFLAGCASIIRPGPGRYALMKNPLIDKGWEALSSKDYKTAHRYADECVQFYAQEAKTYNEACAADYPPDNVNCGLLNGVSQCLFIKFQAYWKTGDLAKAQEVCDELNQHYFNSVIFDPRGWIWKPAKACRDEIEHEKAKRAKGTKDDMKIQRKYKYKTLAF